MFSQTGQGLELSAHLEEYKAQILPQTANRSEISTFQLLNISETFENSHPHKFSLLSSSTSSKKRYMKESSAYRNPQNFSNTNKDHIMEDRFIPSRKIIQQQFFTTSNQDLCSSNANGYDEEYYLQTDPQAITVAEIYAHELLRKNNKAKSMYNFQQTKFKKYDKLSENYDLEPFLNRNLFRYKINKAKDPLENGYSIPTSPLLPKPLAQDYKKSRKISKNPYKVLDAPALTDDFYLNLIAWSDSNQLAVGLGNCIYLWDAVTTKVTRLCELQNDIITSVCWSNDSPQLAIGCNKGYVLLWDVNTQKQKRKMGGHQIRVGAMSWSKKYLSTGSRDKNILQRDPRLHRDYVMKLQEHGQEICGLKWSGDEQYLASGGNDNKVIIWNQNGQPINKFSDHRAAVKALAWSPHQHGLLATGGGTADRMIKLRNIFTSEIISSEDTGSQVCNLQFSKSLHQLVSTHGYSQNQVNVWQYPHMRKIATLKGHTHRVLYLAISPDGSQIVTGAGDQTLRFWNIFPKTGDSDEKRQSQLQFNSFQLR